MEDNGVEDSGTTGGLELIKFDGFGAACREITLQPRPIQPQAPEKKIDMRLKMKQLKSTSLPAISNWKKNHESLTFMGVGGSFLEIDLDCVELLSPDVKILVAEGHTSTGCQFYKDHIMLVRYLFVNRPH